MYCPKCKKHVVHKVTEAKRRTPGTSHPLGKGSRRKKKYTHRNGNHGRYSKPKNQGKMYGQKQTKKVDLRFECSVCKKINIAGRSWRARKVEFE